MSRWDTLVIPPVVLIGPVGVGKSTIAGLLAARMGWPQVSMDAVCAGYYAEVSEDQAVAERPEQAAGVRAAYQAWKPLETYAVERILANHQHAVIDLGGGHSVQEDPTLFARVQAALAKLVVYTAGQTPGQTGDALYRALVRTAS